MLSPQDFKTCNWQQALFGSERPYRVDYNTQFAKQAQNVEENDDRGDHLVFPCYVISPFFVFIGRPITTTLPSQG